MPTSPLSPLSCTLREIARLERGGLRPPRLTEPAHERWHRLRRKLGWVAFIDLLHEDLAQAFPTSFALDRWSAHPTDGLDEAAAKALIDEAAQTDDADRLAFLRLGWPAGLAGTPRAPVRDARTGRVAVLGQPSLLGPLGLMDWLSGFCERARGGKHGLVVLAVPGGIHEDRVCLNEKYNLPYTPDMAAVYLETS